MLRLCPASRRRSFARSRLVLFGTAHGAVYQDVWPAAPKRPFGTVPATPAGVGRAYLTLGRSRSVPQPLSTSAEDPTAAAQSPLEAIVHYTDLIPNHFACARVTSGTLARPADCSWHDRPIQVNTDDREREMGFAWRVAPSSGFVNESVLLEPLTACRPPPQ
jgi:hypothetical protein